MRAVAAAAGSRRVKGSWDLAGNPVQHGPPSRQAVRGAPGWCPDAGVKWGPGWVPKRCASPRTRCEESGQGEVKEPSFL